MCEISLWFLSGVPPVANDVCKRVTSRELFAGLDLSAPHPPDQEPGHRRECGSCGNLEPVFAETAGERYCRNELLEVQEVPNVKHCTV